MTHTLHPEIEEAIKKLCHEDSPEMLSYFSLQENIMKHLGPYLHMPTDLKDNEPLPELKLLGTDFSKEDDIGCEIYGYTKDGNTVITKVNYVTPYVEEEQKQSTPTEEELRMQRPAKKVVIHDTHDMPKQSTPQTITKEIKDKIIDFISTL